jgi:hypothetical protein
MRKIFGKAEQRHFKDFCLHELCDYDLPDFYSESVEDFIEKRVKKSLEDFKQASNALKTHEKQEKQWEEWLSRHGLDCKAEDLSNALNDSSLRSQIFYLAVHYWEAKWLQDMEKWAKQKDKTKIDPKDDWLRRA